MTHRQPDEEEDVDTIEKFTTSCRIGPFNFKAKVNLIKRKGDDQEPKDCVEIILERSAGSIARLDPMNDCTHSALEKVKNKDRNTDSLIRRDKILAAERGINKYFVIIV